MGNENLSKKLRSYRKHYGYTQTGIAKALGLSRSAYTYYENSKTEPSIKNLIKLSEIFQITIDELVKENV